MKHKWIEGETIIKQKYLKCKICNKISFLGKRPRGNKKYKGCFSKIKIGE